MIDLNVNFILRELSSRNLINPSPDTNKNITAVIIPGDAFKSMALNTKCSIPFINDQTSIPTPKGRNFILFLKYISNPINRIKKNILLLINQ